MRGNCGATALFYPRQYTGLYTHLLRPAAHGHLIFAGEAMSIHHWVVGALESGYRAVYQFLVKFGLKGYVTTLVEKFGTIPDLEIIYEKKGREDDRPRYCGCPPG